MTKKSNKRITALVTAVGGRSVGYQILESLKMFPGKYRIIASDMDPFSPGIYEADTGYLLPSADSKQYIEKLVKLIKKEKIDVILPGSQVEVKTIAKHKNVLDKTGAVSIVGPYSVIEMAFNKRKLHRFLTEHKILTPPTVELDSPEKAKGLKFPIVVKPSRDTSGSRNVHIVKDMNELVFLFEDLKREKIELIAQEYVGSEDEEYTVGVLINKNGQILDTIVMKRRLIGLSMGLERKINGKKYILSTGYSQGFFVDRPDVKAYCEHVARVVGTIGPLNIQCRRGKKGVYIFEVHPRFSGSASMRSLMGFNEPDILIRDFLGVDKINEVSYKMGYAVIRRFANTVVRIKDYEKAKKL